MLNASRANCHADRRTHDVFELMSFVKNHHVMFWEQCAICCDIKAINVCIDNNDICNGRKISRTLGEARVSRWAPACTWAFITTDAHMTPSGIARSPRQIARISCGCRFRPGNKFVDIRLHLSAEFLKIELVLFWFADLGNALCTEVVVATFQHSPRDLASENRCERRRQNR